MFTVYCNKCFSAKTITNSNNFFISKCGHIFCQLCKPNGRCRLCKAHFVGITIDGKMPEAMAQYFECPQKVFRRFQKVLQFQLKQDYHVANYWVNYVPHQMQECSKKHNGLMRIDEHLTEKWQHETQRSEKLKKYLAYKQQQLEGMEQDSNYMHSSSICYDDYNNTHGQRAKTPTISTISDMSMSTAKSSDLSRQSDGFTKKGRYDFSI